MLYLAGYLTVGGLGLLAAPDLALSLLFSTGDYGDVMPRVVGMFMLVLAGFIATFIRRGDYSYYGYTIVARTFIVATLTALYLTTRDPLFVVLDGIVLVGLIPAAWIHLAAPTGPR